MTETKRRKRKGAARARRATAKPSGSEQILVTLNVPNGDIIKIEKFAKSGKREELSDEVFAALAGDDDDELDDIGAVIEETYAAGITDALGDDDSEDGTFSSEGPAQESIRHGLRGIVLRRALRREFLKRALSERAAG